MFLLKPLALLTLCIAALNVWAAPPRVQASETPKSEANKAEEPLNSQLDGELFYQLLTAEMRALSGEPATAYPYLMDAARKTGDAAVYQRAVEVALQARSGEAALQAARAWRQALPASREGNRYLLQILLGMNRLTEAVEPLKRDIGLVSPAEQAEAITVVPRFFSRVSNKKKASAVVEQALADQVSSPVNGPAAWTTIGRMRMEADDIPGALAAARAGQAINPYAEGPALLALMLMGTAPELAETLVLKHLDAGKPSSSVRLAYARVLMSSQRYEEAAAQAGILTRTEPELAQAWLIVGTLALQNRDRAEAQAALQRYITLVADEAGKAIRDENEAGLAQAYLALASVAEQSGDLVGAQAWLSKVDNGQELVAAQSRRASILARQGQMSEARQLIRGLPETNDNDARLKLAAETQLLRENKLYTEAYALLQEAIANNPEDTELLYDQAMVAEKLGDLAGMERLLRRVIELKPQSAQAYNALGYSLAERGLRLSEARELVLKALTYAPRDPYIIDSLGWVEFRSGNLAEAQRILQGAFEAKRDAEIGAHLGEVLWRLGKHNEAIAVWRQAQQLAPDNETLQETLKRLGASL
jgi:tetratricopeptide (TPR) repeat protein